MEPIGDACEHSEYRMIGAPGDVKTDYYQLLDEVEQNIVICQGRADQ